MKVIMESSSRRLLMSQEVSPLAPREIMARAIMARMDLIRADSVGADLVKHISQQRFFARYVHY